MLPGLKKIITVPFVWCCAGITLNETFSYLLGRTQAFVAFGAGDSSSERVAYFLTCIAGFLLIGLYDRKLTAHLKTVAVAATISGTLGVGLLVLSYAQSLVAPVILSSAACVFMAASYVAFLAGFLDTVERSLAESQFVAIAALYLLYAFVGTFTISTLPDRYQVLITALLPILVGVCSFMAVRHPRPVPEKRVLHGAAERRLIIQVLLIGFSVVAALSFMDAGVWGHLRYGSSPSDLSIYVAWLAIAVAIPVAWAIFTQCLKKPLSTPYYVPLALIAAIFTVIVFLDSQNIPILSQRKTMFFLYFIGLFSSASLYFAIFSSSRVLRLSLVRMGGLVFCSTWVESFLWSVLLEKPSAPTGALILIGALAIIVILAVASSSSSKPLLSRDDECMRLAGTYGLSERETQILKLLAQGRSVPRIQKELCLAEGTVRTHITHIYRKIGVQSRQEFFDLLA